MIRSALWAENERSWGFSTEARGERAKLFSLHLKSETFVLANLVTFGLLARRPSTPRSSDVLLPSRVPRFGGVFARRRRERGG